MSYAAIAYIIPQYEDHPNEWLKAYEPATTTPKLLATDSTGATTLAKAELDINGFPQTVGTVRFIPFIDGAYDLWLFATEADADSNNTGNAVKMADNITSPPVAGSGTTAIQELTVATMTANTNKPYEVGDVVQTAEFSTGNGGGGTYDVVLTSSVTPNTQDVIIGVSDPLISFVLRFEHESINIRQIGSESGDADHSSIITRAVALAIDSVIIDFASITLLSDVDCDGKKIYCNQTTIPPTPTLLNHGGIINGIVADVNTSERALHQTPSVNFKKTKVLRKFSANEYRGYTIANNGRGYVETTWRDDIVDTNLSNSIGGTSAFRLTKNRNINSCAMLQTAIDARTGTPGADVVRTYNGATGTGTGGDNITYYRVAKNDTIDFDIGTTPISMLTVAVLITTSGSDSVAITSVTTGATLATVDLSGAAEFQTILRIPVNNLAGKVRFTNNDSGTNNMILAGVSVWDLYDDNPQGLTDAMVFSFNTDDYGTNQGANDFALARYNDVTGGSFHGGETVNADTFTVDGVTEVLAVGGITYGREIRHSTNVTITWPSDSATATVVRIEYLADGMLRQIKDFNLGVLEFESVWTCMFETDPALTTTRLAERAGDGVGTSPLHETYQRTNAVQQDVGLTTVVSNYFTVFDNEKNSNGGPYIIDNLPTSRKLYYGPVLFNKCAIGNLSAEQITVFGG